MKDDYFFKYVKLSMIVEYVIEFDSWEELCYSIHSWLDEKTGRWILCADIPPPPSFDPPLPPGRSLEGVTMVFERKYYTVKLTREGDSVKAVVWDLVWHPP